MKTLVRKIIPTRRRSFGLISLAFFLVGTASLIGYHANLSDLEDKALAYGQSHAEGVRTEIQVELADFQKAVDTMAEDLSKGSLDRSSIEARLKLSLRDTPKANGFGVGYAGGNFAPAYTRAARGETRRIDGSALYDYTNKELPAASWYVDTVGKGAPRWTEPYFSESEGLLVTQYAAPFYKPGSKRSPETIAGVVYIQISLSYLTDLTRRINLGVEGYNFIVSRAGKFIAHPDHLFLGTKYQLQGNRLDEEESDQEQAAVPLLGNSVYHKKGDTDRSLPSWMFFEPLAGTGWSLATIVYHNIFAPEGDIRVRALIGIIAAFVGFGNFFVLWIVSREVRSSHSLWAASMLMTAIFVAGILAIWHFHHKYPQMQSGRDVIIASNSKLDQFERDLKGAMSRRQLAAPLKVPTGLIINSVKFTGINETMLSGFIWQKYPLKMPAGVKPGFVFVDALDPQGVAINEVYRIERDDKLVIGWNFRVTLRNRFRLLKYPFDNEVVRIKLWPESLGGGVWLAPDLDDYEFLAPEKRPGLADNVLLENWDFRHSFFSFEFESYNANFGDSRAADSRELIPSLFYNIGVQRVTVSALVAHGIPILVVAILLFCVLLISTENAFSILSYLAALFFVLVISHVGLRSELGINTLVYGERFYLLMYALLLYICADAMLQEAKWEWKILSYNNNLLPKLFYWPFLLAIAFANSVWTFLPPPR
ncbi:MAG: cache domain-containing protein [Elusimicrobiota bacterium]